MEVMSGCLEVVADVCAITIQAPADQVWPWLAQMGYEDRAGSYSYDRFERSVGRNLYQLDPNISPLAVGDAMPFDPAGPWGDDHVAWSWAFVLEPVDATRTRLLVRMRVGYQPAVRWGPAMWLLVEPAHFVMGRRQLLGIRQRAETPQPAGDRERTSRPAATGAEAAAGARGLLDCWSRVLHDNLPRG